MNNLPRGAWLVLALLILSPASPVLAKDERPQAQRELIAAHQALANKIPSLYKRVDALPKTNASAKPDQRARLPANLRKRERATNDPRVALNGRLGSLQRRLRQEREYVSRPDFGDDQKHISAARGRLSVLEKELQGVLDEIASLEGNARPGKPANETGK